MSDFSNPKISICIAIYNRLAPFKYTFERLLDQVSSVRDFFEIVVSVNPSEDGNTEVSEYVIEMSKTHSFVYDINKTNIGGEANILNAVHHASGKYIWIVGDDDLILSSTLQLVKSKIETNNDITWLFLNTARVGGEIEVVKKNLISVKVDNLEEGYFKDAKKRVLSLHRQIDAALLFSSSNIFLRDSMLKIEQHQKDSKDCNQLASLFDAASKGAAYVIDKPCILAGGITTWSDRQDYFLGVHYNRDLLYAIGNGFSKDEIIDLISYRMRNGAIRSWFVVYKMILKCDPLGKIAIKELFSMIPLETIIFTLFSPFVAIYLIMRHYIRNAKRSRTIQQYKFSKDATKEITERI